MYSPRIIIALLLAVLLPEIAPAATITGTVGSTDNEPIIGASVLYRASDGERYGTSTATDGSFQLTIPTGTAVVVQVSALGFTPDSMDIAVAEDTSITFELTPREIDVGQISVRPDRHAELLAQTVGRRDIDRLARTSLVPTNPIAAIKGPSTARQGSQHSSKIRVNGTNPEYRLNNFPIGHDPTHYGVFSLLTGSVIERAALHSHGNDASLGSPAELQLHTIRPFGRNQFGTVNLSLTDLSGMTAVGSDDAYIVGSLRKSVLDKLVRYLDLSADRITLPPTNFQDVFVSGGYRFSPDSRVLLDYYDSRDHLSYTYESSDRLRDDRNASQSTVRTFWGMTVEQIFTDMLIRSSLSRRTSDERYQVASGSGDRDGLYVDLSLQETILSGAVDITRYFEQSAAHAGLIIEKTHSSDLRLSHKYWNFQPPDAVSDNPYIYQQELNFVHDSYNRSTSPMHSAGYVGYEYGWPGVRLTSGFRVEHFNDLAAGPQLLLRQKVTVDAIAGHTFTVAAGTYAEHPYTSILESNQVLVHQYPYRLLPVRTSAASIGWSHEWLTAVVSAKNIRQLPGLVPDFAEGPTDPDFLAIASVESATFYGFDITVDKQSLLTDLDLYAFYGYTYGRSSMPDAAGGRVGIPHDLTAPHRLLIETQWHPGDLVRLGTELAVRSGYAYTPHYTPEDYRNVDRYTPAYYRETMAEENSRRFPAAISLNLHLSFDLGRTAAFLNLANVTNHANPIINTIDGYVYDAGILPTVGLTYRF